MLQTPFPYVRKPYLTQVPPVTTTDATKTTLVTIPTASDTEILLEINVSGIKSDGAKTIGTKLLASYKNDGGTLTRVGSFDTRVMDEVTDTDHIVATEASGTNILITVIGKTGETIKWKPEYHKQVVKV